MADGPLSGIRVLDLCGYLAGPYGCTLLGDLGADVVKVEPPGGDAMRAFPSSLPGEARGFVGVNRNKRSIVIDLKQDAGRAVLHRLVARSDVLVENFRPAVPARLGIDYPTLRALNPRLVYCGLTGYGDTGPLVDAAGFDQVLQSMTGIARFQGRGEAPQVVLGSIVDYYTAALTALGVVAALHHRARTGVGQYLSTSLLRSALTMQAARFVWTDTEPREASRELTTGRVAGIHPTADGYLYLSAHTQEFWRALCEIVGLPELARDPRYDTMRKRAERDDELLPLLHAALARRPAAEWERLMQGRVPAAMVRPIEDVFDHPQAAAEALVASVEHPTLGRYRTLAQPIRFAETPGPAPRAAPTLGQHTDAVLDELGIDAAERAALRADGAVA
ncbi:MAG TPA: CoA transferase [Candidatus Sulfotelmatobacter sp.]|nr:CoA transferase [Candidatus Sulfotelmatobacter sp.]